MVRSQVDDETDIASLCCLMDVRVPVVSQLDTLPHLQPQQPRPSQLSPGAALEELGAGSTASPSLMNVSSSSSDSLLRLQDPVLRSAAASWSGPQAVSGSGAGGQPVASDELLPAQVFSEADVAHKMALLSSQPACDIFAKECFLATTEYVPGSFCFDIFFFFPEGKSLSGPLCLVPVHFVVQRGPRLRLCPLRALFSTPCLFLFAAQLF